MSQRPTAGCTRRPELGLVDRLFGALFLAVVLAGQLGIRRGRDWGFLIVACFLFPGVAVLVIVGLALMKRR